MISQIKTTLAAITLIVAFGSQTIAQEPPSNSWVPQEENIDASTGENFDIVIGDPNASVTIYEYASLTCPHCKNFHENTLPEIKSTWIDSGKVKLVYRHFPLDQSALAASMTIQCLPEEKRAQTLSLLFSKQQQWAGTSDFVPFLQEAYGADFTIKEGEKLKDSLVACISRPQFAENLMSASFEAHQNGVTSTPYFFIEDERVEGAQSHTVISTIIKEKLAEKE